MKGKKIVLGITGSIAAYKAAVLTRLLIKKGAEVQIVITPAGKEFITPITLSALTSKPVISEFFSQRDGTWHSHVDLGLWADAMVIAPATASTIGKMAHGIADNMLVTTYLSMKAPVFVAPAMDLDMFAHPSTQHNLDILRSYGNHIIEPASGELASHLVGKGRMEEPEKIVEVLEDFFAKQEDLKGKKLGVGSADSSQANIMAIYYLNKNGLKIKESDINNSEIDNESVNIIRYNSDLGKHGDTGRSEWDVLEGLKNGSLDAGTIGSNTWIRILEEGLYPDGELISFYTSPDFCHCNFTVMPNTDAEISNNFVNMLMSQKKENPIIKKMMAMEGLNEWIITGEKELKGYDTLYEAMREQKLL